MLKLVLITTLLTAFAGLAAAADAGVQTQKFPLGRATVWAIADNTGARNMSIFQAPPEVVRQYVAEATSPSGVLCFLIQAPGKTILLDTGNGASAGGLLMPGLAAAGVKPEDVDLVVITHMHGDHIGGLALEGRAAFPNAVVKIGRLERDFWTADESARQFPQRQSGFDMARRILALYDGRVETFEFGEAILPGLDAIDARGHTPGHSGILVTSGGEQLLCVGDILHAAALQFPRPDINSSYDMQDAETKYSRMELLSKAAREGLPIAGMHLPFPGIGRVKENGKGGFAFAPGL